MNAAITVEMDPLNLPIHQVRQQRWTDPNESSWSVNTIFETAN